MRRAGLKAPLDIVVTIASNCDRFTVSKDGGSVDEPISFCLAGRCHDVAGLPGHFRRVVANTRVDQAHGDIRLDPGDAKQTCRKE